MKNKNRVKFNKKYRKTIIFRKFNKAKLKFKMRNN